MSEDLYGELGRVEYQIQLYTALLNQLSQTKDEILQKIQSLESQSENTQKNSRQLLSG